MTKTHLDVQKTDEDQEKLGNEKNKRKANDEVCDVVESLLKELVKKV